MTQPKASTASRTRRPLYLVVTLFLFVALVLSMLFAVTIGSVSIPFTDVYRVILFQAFEWGDGAAVAGKVHDVVWLIRLPRLILAVFVGAALAISGLVMQAIVRNPIADSHVLGVSSGAFLGASLAIVWGTGRFLGNNFPGIMAFFGAFGASIAVASLASIGGRANPVKLILFGTALSALCTALADFAIYNTHDANAVQEIIVWNMGSLAAAKWERNAILAFVVTLGILFFLSQYRRLNLMLLGDEASLVLGSDLHPWRIVYLLVCSLLIAFSVQIAGMIGFVGLVIPHVMRLIFGTDHKKLIPLCALAGALFLVWADVLCRVLIRGTELPIGILTAAIGAPCFIYLLAKKKYGFGNGAT